jgi:RNA polymerase sigma-70 factor (ECF subfamily)
MNTSGTSWSLPLDAADPARAADARAPSEADLIERARTDPAAFAEIYRHHYASVGTYLWRRCGDAHATEDMLGEVFLSALKGLSRFRSRGVPLRFWLYRIATNVANRRWRELASRAEEPADGTDADVFGAECSPGDELERDESREAAQRALLALTPDLQAVLSLHYIQDLSTEDVARILECPVGTVKSRLSRARTAFTLALERRSPR